MYKQQISMNTIAFCKMANSVFIKRVYSRLEYTY